MQASGKAKMKLKLLMTALLALSLVGCGNAGEKQVAEINNDWTGNEIKIEAFQDDKISGIICHMAHFDRGVLDRLTKGEWFENPSNGSISCTQTGPIVIGDIELKKKGEEVFRQRQSLIFKKLTIRRIYDAENETLIYLVYSRKIVDGSAKMSIATLPLYGKNAQWLSK